MAANRSVRKVSRVTKNSSNAFKIQRVINRDYKILFQDYKKLSLELWRIPATRYILGGAVVTSLVPVIMGALKRNPQIVNFFRTNVDAIEHKVESIGEIITDKIADLQSNMTEEVSEARH